MTEALDRGFRLQLPPELLERLAERAAELAIQRLEAGRSAPSEFMTTQEAAELLRCKPQRIHDLLSARRLSRFKEGARTLVLREEVEALAQLATQRRGCG